MTYESAQDFDKRHGEYYIENGALHFADGAWRENSVNGMRCDPSTDIRDSGPKMIRYRETVLARVSGDFNELRNSLELMVGMANKTAEMNAPQQPPSDQHFQRLEELQAKVVQAQRALKKVRREVEAKIANLPENIRRREGAAALREQADNAAKRLKKIKV